MIYLLDANTCIGFLNGTSERIRHHMETVAARDIALCSVVKAEMIYGAFKSAWPERNLIRQRHFFRRFVSLPFDDSAADAYGEIRAHLEKVGKLIGPNDLMIAAIARANGLTLVTHNTREFQRVEGLRLTDWQ